MKKLLLSFLSILVFASVAHSWVVDGQTWRYRYRFDYNDNISGTLTDFPTALIIDSSAGDGAADITDIFDEVGGDYSKIIITSSDGATPLYSEVARWDASAEKAAIYIKDTCTSNDYGYVYFDNTAGPNSYIGRPLTTSGVAVWDANYKLVSNMTKNTESIPNNMTQLWFCNSRAIRFGSKTYYVFVDVTDTDIKIIAYNNLTNLWGAQTKIADATGNDAHCAPTIDVDSSGYLWVAWSDSDVSPYKVWAARSTNINDETAWGAAEEVAATDAMAAYAKIIIYSDDSKAVFFRETDTSGAYEVRRSIRNDGTSSWGDEQLIIQSSITQDGPYFDVFLDGNDRLHMAWHWLDRSELLMHDIYYAYSDDSNAATPAWKEADGGTVTLPLAESVGNLVIDTDASWDAGYLIGVVADSNSIPWIAFGVYDSVNTPEIQCARYSSGWGITTVVADAGACIDYGTKEFDGDISVISSTTARIMYVDKTATNQTDLREYITTNSNTSWAKNRDIVNGSSGTTTLFPCYVENYQNPVNVIYLRSNTLTSPWTVAHSLYYAADYDVSTRILVNQSTPNAGIDFTDGTGPASSTNIDSGSLLFDGSNDFIKFSDSDNYSFGDSAYTVEVLLNKSTSYAEDDTIISKMDNSTNREWVLALRSTTSDVRFFIYDHSADAYIGRRGGSYTAGAWTHIMGTYSGNAASSGVNILKNGVDVDSADYQSGTYIAYENLAAKLCIGARDATSSEGFIDGYMGLVRLSNVVRSTSYGVAVYNGEIDNLVTWQPLETSVHRMFIVD